MTAEISLIKSFFFLFFFEKNTQGFVSLHEVK